MFVNGTSLLREEYSIGMDGVRPELVRDCPEIFRENSGKIPGDFVHKKRSLFFKKLQNVKSARRIIVLFMEICVSLSYPHSPNAFSAIGAAQQVIASPIAVNRLLRRSYTADLERPTRL